jgi:hypothetical protein
MSIWAHYVDELETLMLEIILKRIDEREFIPPAEFGETTDLWKHKLREVYESPTGICRFIADMFGDEFCGEMMSEALVAFYEREADKAETMEEFYDAKA